MHAHLLAVGEDVQLAARDHEHALREEALAHDGPPRHHILEGDLWYERHDELDG